MKPYVKTYMKYFGFTIADFIPCEICQGKSCEIHHIDARGMGGDPLKKKDVIENLQAVCRECHVKYGDDPKYFDTLIETHLNYMKHNKV